MPISRRTIRRGSWIALPVAFATGAAFIQVEHASASSTRAHAMLRDANGAGVGYVKFTRQNGTTLVDATFNADSHVTKNAFHGFHIHANNDPSNKAGCVADAKMASKDWFVSADGHLSKDGQTHGSHQGDMPSPLIGKNGSGHLTFTTDRFTPADVVGKAVILHAKPDNFGNVPVGGDTEQYTANQGAVEKTTKTGNAGDRVACGVVKSG